MASHNLGLIEKEIRRLQHRLARIENMRPGTLSIQYRDPASRNRGIPGVEPTARRGLLSDAGAVALPDA